MLRSIQQTVEHIRRIDPDSAIKVHTITTWVKEGKIDFKTVGKKILINLDSLLEYIGEKPKED